MSIPMRNLTPAQAALVIADGAFRVNHDIGSVAQSVQEGVDEHDTPVMWIRVYNGWLYAPLDEFNEVQRWGASGLNHDLCKLVADTFKPDPLAV